MGKQSLNEVNIAGFINKFLDDIRKGTQDRFIKQAEQRIQDKKVHLKLREIDRSIQELEDYLKTL